MSEELKAMRDAKIHGTGIMRDGKHIPHDEFFVQPPTNDLKPCPFCGSAGLYCQNRNSEFGMHWVLCNSCHACPGDRRTKAEAIAAWNQRAPISGEGQIERAREYVATSMHDRDKSWGDLVLAGERDDCPEMRMVLKAMATEAALLALQSSGVDAWQPIEDAFTNTKYLVIADGYDPAVAYEQGADWMADSHGRPESIEFMPTHFQALAPFGKGE